MGWGEFWDAAAEWAIIWIPVLGPLGILATAVIAYFAYRQKLEADRRAQWWVRAQWALEASLSANRRRSLAGLAVLNDLKTSSLATAEDRELFRLIALTARDELAGAASLRAPETPAHLRSSAPDVSTSESSADRQPQQLGSAMEERLRMEIESLLDSGNRRPRVSDGSSRVTGTDLSWGKGGINHNDR